MKNSFSFRHILQKYFKFNKTLKRIIVYMVFPCLVLIMLIVFMFRYSISQQTDYYKSTCINSINSAFNDIEYKMKGISDSIEVLSYNAQFVSALAPNLGADPDTLGTLRAVLKNIKRNNKYIDSIIVYDKAVHNALFNSEIHDSSVLFDLYSYADYTPSYWYNYRFPISVCRFLSPTRVTAGGENRNIVPLVYTRLGNNYLNKLIIINISLDKLLQDTASEYPISIINKQTMTSFSAAEPGKPSKLSPEIVTIMQKNNFYSGNLQKNGEKYLFVYTSPSKSLLGYSYYSLIPHSAIYSKIFHIIIVFVALIILVIIAAVFIILFGSHKIFEPIANIAHSLGSDTESDTFKYINDAIRQIQKSNSSLDMQYKDSLSKIQKLYLVNLLNSDEDSLVKVDMKEYFSFPNEYFCSCIYKILPSKNLNSLINPSEFNHVLTELFVCIKEEYASAFDCVVLPSEENVLYLLLNPRDMQLTEEIEALNQNLLELLKIDSSIIDISVAIGGIYDGLTGLKKSHREALYKINKNIKTEGLPASVNISMTAPAASKQFSLSLSDESTLLNYLVSFKTELASELIEKILNENINRSVSENELIKLYIKIITIITNVFDAKKIPYDILGYNSVLSAVSDMFTVSLVELHDIISTLLKELRAYVDSHHQQLDITNIIKYIEENYDTDLYLDGIAEIFQTSPKYLSKLIKSKLGVNFTDYLNEYRIKQAMKMLRESDIKITELYSRVGFNNRNSFSNFFKKFAGMSPSEYKKSLKNS